jgi:hypothetical protein
MIAALVLCFGYAVLVWLVFFYFRWLKFMIMVQLALPLTRIMSSPAELRNES